MCNFGLFSALGSRRLLEINLVRMRHYRAVISRRSQIRRRAVFLPLPGHRCDMRGYFYLLKNGSLMSAVL
jgi:hypothetical protein